MTTLHINSFRQPDINAFRIKSASFTHLNKKVLSANKIEKMYGVFISQVILAPSNFIQWKSYQLNTNSMDNVWIYFRSSNSNIEQAPWIGPFKNANQNIDNSNEKLFQFMIIMLDDGVVSAQINSIQLNFVSAENAKLFFSKTFNIGFRPEHIILTYNAEKSDNAVLRFAITGEETTDVSKYQYIEPNQIQELYSIPLYSDKIKLMMELAGDSGIPIKIHEISFMFSGNKYDKINIKSVLSSSSSSSFSSSSSSLDSSSSESTMSTSSSSSMQTSSSSSLKTSSSSSSVGTSSSSSLKTSSSSSSVGTSSSSSSL